jgi:hypothetical protein
MTPLRPDPSGLRLPRFVAFVAPRAVPENGDPPPAVTGVHGDAGGLAAWPLFGPIVHELGELGYAGWWAFHHCSDPPVTVRLIREVEQARALVPPRAPGLLVDLLCLGSGYLRIARYPTQAGGEWTPVPVHEWLVAGGLLGPLSWRFAELAHGWAAVHERDGLRVDVIRPRPPAGASPDDPGTADLPLSSSAADSPHPRVTPSSPAVDGPDRVAMCRTVFGSTPPCGRHTVGNVRERSFADLWSSPTLSSPGA